MADPVHSGERILTIIFDIFKFVCNKVNLYIPTSTYLYIVLY
jgi:hypothetical protein